MRSETSIRALWKMVAEQMTEKGGIRRFKAGLNFRMDQAGKMKRLKRGKRG